MAEPRAAGLEQARSGQTAGARLATHGTVSRNPADHGGPAPVHLQIAADVRSAIAGRTYKVGARLPAPPTLAGEYGVSAWTARRAFEVLRGEGLIVAIERLGYFVARPAGPDDGVVQRLEYLKAQNELRRLRRRLRSMEAINRQPPGLPRWDPARLPADALPEPPLTGLWVGV